MAAYEFVPKTRLDSLAHSLSVVLVPDPFQLKSPSASDATHPVRSELDCVRLCGRGISKCSVRDTTAYLTIVFNDKEIVDRGIAQCLLASVSGHLDERHL
jgi:hypothetical protein